MKTVSKTSKVLAHLQSGKALTPAQIRGQFAVRNPHDVVMNLRRRGHCIYTTQRELHTGKVTSEYVLGRPSPEMVALAAAFSASFFK